MYIYNQFLCKKETVFLKTPCFPLKNYVFHTSKALYMPGQVNVTLQVKKIMLIVYIIVIIIKEQEILLQVAYLFGSMVTYIHIIVE